MPPSEIHLILAHILQKSREYVLTHPEIRLSKAQKARFEKLKKRRQNREPMAYILGHKEFYGLDFKVNKHTLIPRPETELLVEEALNSILQYTSILKDGLAVIDVGTGTGNIVISLAKNIGTTCPGDVQGPSKDKKGHRMSLYGIDISLNALRVAKQNAKAHKVHKKIKFLKSNLLSPLLNTKYKIQNTIIIANLPYLSKKIYDATAPDVKNFEPKSALVSGTDGLDHYEKLFKQLKEIIVHCSLITVRCFLEISPEQKPKLEKLIKKYFPRSKVEFKKDLASKWRVASFSISS